MPLLRGDLDFAIVRLIAATALAKAAIALAPKDIAVALAVEVGD